MVITAEPCLGSARQQPQQGTLLNYGSFLPRQMPRAQAGIDAQRRCGIDQNGGSIRVWYGKITRAVSGRKGTRIA